jgi:glycosyltransferase involved in cell wall biosynthesis
MKALLTILLPFFNEEGWIGKTLDSLAQQTDRRFRLLLLDNGSTDQGAAEALRHLTALADIEADILSVSTPGKVNALATGLPLVNTPYVAICDADTCYPSGYVARCLALFSMQADAAAVMAIDLYHPAGSKAATQRVDRVLRKVRRYRNRCHAGGYAQTYRTDALRAAGGFDMGRWPFVLEDHEIVHRVMRMGRVIYDRGHYCFPSQRRADRSHVSWTWGERLLYRFVPHDRMDWFFYDFLWHRLERRNAYSVALREKDWT